MGSTPIPATIPRKAIKMGLDPDHIFSETSFEIDSLQELESPNWRVTNTSKDAWKKWIADEVKEFWYKLSYESKFYIFLSANKTYKLIKQRQEAKRISIEQARKVPRKPRIPRASDVVVRRNRRILTA